MYTKEMVLLKFLLKTLMCLPFQHMVELTTHLKETSDLDIAFDDNTSDDEFLKIISAVIQN
jgi:hypothetical protein